MEEVLALLDDMPAELREQMVAQMIQEGGVLLRPGCNRFRPRLCAATEQVPDAVSTLPAPEPGTVSIGLGFSVIGTASDPMIVLLPAEGGPAHRAGLKLGDVLLTIDGQPMTTPDSAVEVIRGQPAGADFDFGVRRGGEELSVTVTSEQAGGAI